MHISAFDYYIPKEQIAQYPLEKRDASRLCVLDRRQKRCEHRVFREIVDYLNEGDVLVLNDTKVMPSRIYAIKPSGGRVEIMLLREVQGNEWDALVRGTREDVVIIKDGITANISPFNGLYRVRFEGSDINTLLKEVGRMPLPPYIKRESEEIDKRHYQTVYAEKEGAVAAPTAGLHFTDETLDAIRKRGVEVVKLTLHVGYGTFKPVRVEDIERHKMDEEYYEIPEETAYAVNLARAEGRRVIAVGTTVTRALESSSTEAMKIRPGTGMSALFIYPGYDFRIVDALVTNLHQPRSTPMILTSAFAGLALLKEAYAECQRRGYRFFSYGDAMLII
jgi:S-adenosylmethionine:tRNA ribosyltransferase-isomerase